MAAILLPGRTLYLLSTGTGLAPFLSIIRDPETYERFETVVLVHGCRQVAYAERIMRDWPNDEFVGERLAKQLIYYPTVTREPFRNRGRIDELIASGRRFADTGRDPLDAGQDRAMLYGSPDMLAGLRALLEARAFTEGSSHAPGTFVVEKAFVER